VILGSWFLWGDFRQLVFPGGFFRSGFVFIYVKALAPVITVMG
jgi:hypothetical protein